MDWLNRARQFVGNLFGGAARTVSNIAGGVARGVSQGEQQAARVAQQAVRNVSQIQAPRIQLPQVRIQGPKVDLSGVNRALQQLQQAGQGFNQGLDISRRTFTGQQLTPQQQNLVNQIPGGRTLLAVTPRQQEVLKTFRAGIPVLDVGLDIKQKGLGAFSPQEIMQRGPLSAVTQQISNTGKRLINTPEGRQLQKQQGFIGQVARVSETVYNSPQQAIAGAFDVTGQKIAQVPGIKQFNKTQVGKILNEYVVSPTTQSFIDTFSRVGGASAGQKTYADGLQGYAQLANDIFNVGSLAYTGGLAGQLGKTSGKEFLITAAKLAPRLAASGAGQNIITQLAQGKKINEINYGDVLGAASAYTALGIGLPSVSKLGNKVTNKVFNLGKSTVKTAQALPVDKNAPIIVRTLPEKGALRAQGYTNVQVQFTPKPGQVTPTIPSRAIAETAPVPKSYLKPKNETSLAELKISTKPVVPKEPISAKALQVKAQFLNRFDPIERFVRKIELERGTKLKPSENPMYYVKQFMGGGGIANYKIDNELTPMLKQTKNFDGLRQYLVARRMNELAGRGIGKKANTAIAELTQKYGPQEIANFDKIAGQLYKYQRNQLDELLTTGVISKQSYDNIIAKNQFYIPFNRVVPDIMSQTTQGGQKISGAKTLGSLKAIKGSEKEIIDPIESLIKNTYDVQATVAKQKVLNSLVALAPDEFKPLPKGAGLKAPAIELFSDGKRIKFGADPELAKTLNSMDEEQLNLVVRAMSLPAKTLRAGATSLNVAFALPNVLRDQLSAAVNSKYGGIPIYDFVSGLASVIKKDDSYKKWVLSGADQATLFAQDRTTLRRGVKDITGGLGYKAGKLVKSPLELFRIFGDLSEKGSRVGVFKRALKGASKEGLNTQDALLTAMRESREATIDFAQRGSKMKAFNAMVPFLNARVQGTYKLMQSFKNRPVQTMMRGAAIASVPAAILYIHNNAGANAEVYKEIPDYIKREYFVIVTGDKNTPFIKIPKGEVGKIFANPVESFMATVKNDNPNWAETAKSIADSFLPVGSISEPARFVTDIGPTAVTVPYQLLSNYDAFRNRDIVGQYQKDLPAAQQFSKYNTETAKKIGQLLNISPAQLEFALSGLTGGLGRQGLQVADIAQGQRPPVQELPVLSRFLGQEKDLNASAQDIYKQAEKAKQDKARENFAIKEALKKGDTSVLQRLDKSTASRLQRSVAEDKAKEQLSPIQKALFDLPQAQLDALKQTGQYKDDIAAIENIQNSITENLKGPKAPKVKISKRLPKARKGRKARVAKVSMPKAPRLRAIKVSVPKGKKVSFKQPTATKARKSIKIKTG
jgi:hypothetical protein